MRPAAVATEPVTDAEPSLPGRLDRRVTGRERPLSVPVRRNPRLPGPSSGKVSGGPKCPIPPAKVRSMACGR
jgi:hypothetical protein